jgi:hypothetical protein
MTLNDTDPTFVDDLEASQEAVWHVARWLSNTFKQQVSVRPVHIRPDDQLDERMKYSDEGDLQIIKRVEVKERKGITFTSLKDFPFKEVIVDVIHSYDNAVIKPYMYVILSADHKYCLVVPSSTRSSWRGEMIMDEHAGRKRGFYLCPINLCTCYAMKER